MSDTRYTDIESLIRKSYPEACILYIDEIINPCLEARFQKRRTTMKGVKSMFHGTKESTINQIITNGFDPLFNVRAVHGPGVYFAENAMYSSAYMFSSKPGDPTFMFLADVLVGETGKDNYHGPEIMTTVHADGAFPRFLIAFHKGKGF